MTRTGAPSWRRVAWIAVLLPALATTGCSSPWNTETFFRFSDLPEDRAFVMKAVFNEHELVSEIVADEEMTTFRVRGIGTTRELGAVLDDVKAVARAEGISAPLERAALTFGTLNATGRVYTTIEVTVSPGAKVYVADRDAKQPWRTVTVKNGVYRGVVNTTKAVADQGGWVYIMAVRDSGRTFSRVNVLTGAFERRVTKPDLPDPPGLR